MKPSLGRCSLGLLIVGWAVGSAGATEALRPALKELSANVARVVQGRHKSAVAVGAFTGPAKYQASAGPGIQKILMEELQKLGLGIDRRADLEVKGEYSPVTLPPTKLPNLLLTVVVVDTQTRKKIAELEGHVPDPEVLPTVLGANCIDLREEVIRRGKAAGTPSAEVRKDLDRLEEDPQFKGRVVASVLDLGDSPTVSNKAAGPWLDGNTLRAAAGRPFGIAVLHKSGDQYRASPLTLTDGQAFAALEKGRVFAIQVVNDADHEVAVELTLDGLNLFAFSEVKDARYVLAPAKSVKRVLGWHRSLTALDEFVITDYGKSAAAEKLIASDQVGTITAVFHAAWPVNDSPPASETGGRSIGVGRGNQVVVRSEAVERKIGRQRDVVSVRYKRP